MIQAIAIDSRRRITNSPLVVAADTGCTFTVDNRRIRISEKYTGCPLRVCRYEDDEGDCALSEWLRDAHFIDVVANSQRRQNLIAHIVQARRKERASLRELAARFEISSTTVRRYLAQAKRADEPRQIQLFTEVVDTGSAAVTKRPVRVA